MSQPVEALSYANKRTIPPLWVALLVATALFAALLVSHPLLTPAASAQTTEDVVARDNLIANQEALLNVYRCRFNIDTHVVPGGCTNGKPARAPAAPVPFQGAPTPQDISARDNLIANQEALLNVYRCRFNIDTHVVPGGCTNEAQSATEAAEGTPSGGSAEIAPELEGAWELLSNNTDVAGIRLTASSTENYTGNAPHMDVWCFAEGEVMYFTVTFPDEQLYGAGPYWLNGTRRSAKRWVTLGEDTQSVIADSDVIGQQNWFRDVLFEMIENPGSFRLQVQDGSPFSPIATFDLTGLDEAIEPVLETCKILYPPLSQTADDGWQLVRNDGEWVQVRLLASATENYTGNTPRMELVCRADGKIVFFTVVFPGERLEGAKAYWLNGTRHSATSWVTQGNNDQVIVDIDSWQDSQEGFRDILFEMIENPGTFVIQADDNDSTPPAARFDLAGLPEAITPVFEACGILSRPLSQTADDGWQLVGVQDGGWIGIRLLATSVENYAGNTPRMYVWCRAEGQVAHLRVEFPDERLKGVKAYWLNGTKHSATRWKAQGDNDQFVLYNMGYSIHQDWFRDTIFEMVENPGTFKLEADDGDDTPPTATFDLAGLPEAIRPVLEACGLSSEQLSQTAADGWQLIRDDDEWTHIRLMASSAVHYVGNTPHMDVWCRAKGRNVYFGEGQAIYFEIVFPDERLIGANAYWFNETKQDATNWATFGDHKQTIRWNNGHFDDDVGDSQNQAWFRGILFLMVEDPGTFKLEADDGDDTPPTATFDLAGLPEAIKPVFEACGLSSEQLSQTAADGWQLVRDDNEWTHIRLMATSSENYLGNTPHMDVWCRAEGPDIYIDEGLDIYFEIVFPDERLYGARAYWLNETRHSATDWLSVGSKGQAVRWTDSPYDVDVGDPANQEWFRDTLFEMVENAGIFKIEADDGDDTPPAATFDLSGLQEAIAPVLTACGILSEPIPQTAADGWQLVRDDHEWTHIRLMASSTEHYVGNTPHMDVLCRAEGSDVYFEVVFPYERLEGATTYWLNGTKNSATHWTTIGNDGQVVRGEAGPYISTSEVGYSENQGWFRDILFEMIEKPETFKLEADDNDSAPPIASFDLSGLQEAIAPVLTACGILSEPIPQTAADGWQLVRDDHEWTHIRLMASSTEHYVGNTPHMDVLCRAEGSDVYFEVVFPYERLKGATAYWLNGTKYSAPSWAPTGSNYQAIRRSAGSYSDLSSYLNKVNWVKDTLLEMIENPGTFTLQANDGDDTPPTATFNLAGLPEAVQPIRQACGI